MARGLRTASGLSRILLDYLIPVTVRADSQRRLHAVRTVAFGLAMIFWAPVFAPIYYVLGAHRGAVMIACAAGAIVLSLLSMRWTQSVELAANLIAASIFFVLIGLAAISGGIQAASVSWLPAVTIIALILCGKGASIAWTAASCLACLILLSLPRLEISLANDIPGENQPLLEFAATCGIVLCAFTLTYLFKASEAVTRQALQIACVQSDQASRAKSTFLANMSHEIRTPLNAVLGMTELMRDTPVTRQQQEYLEIAQDSGKALLALVDDILDFSRIEAGKLVLARQRFDVHQSLLRTLKALAVPAHQQGLELVCHIEPNVPRYVVGDSGRLRQIVMNLVGNAIKFTEQGDIVLRVRREKQTADTMDLHFAVIDTGMGIPVDRQEAIFHLFEQADMSTTRRYGGVGLGLAITSHLVQAMGGRIDLTSEVGKGSTFAFTASFGRAGGDQLAASAAPVSQRVLVVDDHATSRQVLVEMLSGWGMQVQSTAHSRVAMDLIVDSQASSSPYGIVLLNASLASGDGFQLADEIRHNAKWTGRLLMMLTCDRLPEHVAKCERLGVPDYLVKPIGRGELWDAIQHPGISSGRSESVWCGEEESRGPSPRPLQVLLAEDSLVNQKLASAMVKKLGHEVVVATNGLEAVTVWESQDVDLILMDIQMPEMDGLAATQMIRNRERHTGSHVPIVAVTAHALPDDRDKCMAAGMDEYLAKPIRAMSLAAVIETVLKKAASQDR